MTTKFFIPLERVPTVTHQEKAVKVVKGKPVFYEPARLKAARELLTANLARFRPDTPYSSGVRLTTLWCFLVKPGHRDGEYKLSRPDTDNLQKLLKDCMTKVGFWKDDALVASELVEKFWSNAPGIFIRIEELP
ncbi:MAG: RusA family crossover junction endodeoxyribonuclease [Clostridia bacterium]|nr:RusA family crossover junction endodeoxyribonuclease [Clostridia bacterium]